MTRSWPVIVFAVTFILYFPVDAFWNLHLLKKTNNILRSEFRVVMSTMKSVLKMIPLFFLEVMLVWASSGCRVME
jgi:hypothetical protein